MKSRTTCNLEEALFVKHLKRYDHRVPVVETEPGSVIDEGIVDASVITAGLKNLR